MGLYIALGVNFALFLAAAFIAARYEDELQKERNLVKNLLNDIAHLKAKIKILETKVKGGKL